MPKFRVERAHSPIRNLAWIRFLVLCIGRCPVLLYDENSHKFLDKSFHNPEFVEPPDYDTSSPIYRPTMREGGRAAGEAMWAATGSAVVDAKACRSPKLGFTLRASLIEDTSLARWEETTAVKSFWAV